MSSAYRDIVEKMQVEHDHLLAEIARKDEALRAIANWRKDSADYTDSMNVPRRKMDEAQVIHIENEARRALQPSETPKEDI